MSHTVLVCDDAIFMRTMISDILSQAGFEIVGEYYDAAVSGADPVDARPPSRPFRPLLSRAVRASLFYRKHFRVAMLFADYPIGGN